jgi:hypothetical protein
MRVPVAYEPSHAVTLGLGQQLRLSLTPPTELVEICRVHLSFPTFRPSERKLFERGSGPRSRHFPFEHKTSGAHAFFRVLGGF